MSKKPELAIMLSELDTLIKPSQFIDEPEQMPAFLKEVYRRIEALP